MTLRTARKQAGLTVRQAAQKSGYGRNTICRWENGFPPRIDRLFDICQVYGISIQDLCLEDAEQARREDEGYFNRVDSYTNLKCCEDCKDDSDPLFNFYGDHLCEFCIRTRLKKWSTEAIIHEISTEPHTEELGEKEILIDFILENAGVFYG